MENGEIIRRAQAGDRLAFGTLFDTYYPCVYRYLRERLGGAPEAEDLCQEVFLDVLSSIDEYPADGPVSFDEWLLRVAHRLATDYHRHNQGHRRPPVQQPVPVISRLNPAAIALLPEHFQQIVTFRFHSDLSVRQTAASLGLHEDIVKKAVQAAMETWLRYAPAAEDRTDP
jgi:RNA polymerase sigma-70 factor (ECF subfamily)